MCPVHQRLRTEHARSLSASRHLMPALRVFTARPRHCRLLGGLRVWRTPALASCTKCLTQAEPQIDDSGPSGNVNIDSVTVVNSAHQRRRWQNKTPHTHRALKCDGRSTKGLCTVHQCEAEHLAHPGMLSSESLRLHTQMLPVIVRGSLREIALRSCLSLQLFCYLGC